MYIKYIYRLLTHPLQIRFCISESCCLYSTDVVCPSPWKNKYSSTIFSVQIIFTYFDSETKDIISEVLFYILFWVPENAAQGFVYVEDMDMP